MTNNIIKHRQQETYVINNFGGENMEQRLINALEKIAVELSILNENQTKIAEALDSCDTYGLKVYSDSFEVIC